MAKIKQANKKDVVAVFEDPRPNANTIYFYGDAHNKETLAPIFDGHLNFKFNSGAWDTVGYTSATNSVHSAGAVGMSMATSKDATSVIYHDQTGNEPRNNVNIPWALSMDEDNPSRPVQYFTDGTSDMIIWMAYTEGYSSRWFSTWSNVSSDDELHQRDPAYYNNSGGASHNTWYYTYHAALYKDPNSDYISGIYGRSRPHTSYNNSNPPLRGIMRLNSFPVYASVSIGYEKNSYIVQLIGGSDNDGLPFYLFNYTENDKTQIVSRHNITNNNETVMHTFNSTPLASGSNYGGDRDRNGGLRTQVKVSSKVFADPSSSGNECWYTPYFDTSNNYFPFFFQWDKSTDTFTRNEDVTVSGDLSSNHLADLNGYKRGEQSGTAGVIYNETFEFSGTRYLTVMPIASGKDVNDGTSSARTIVTYSIDAANPKALTHHSAVTVPRTIKNIVWLRDDRTQLGVFNEDSFHIYTFDATNGWVKTSTFPYQFWSVGRDSTGKVYATAYNGTGHVDVHLITTTTPTSVVITPASSTYDYQGTTIDSTVAISAFGSDGERLAVTVDLTIEGSTMTFGDGTTAATVTTSDSADVDQAIKITGAGFSDIIARVQI